MIAWSVSALLGIRAVLCLSQSSVVVVLFVAVAVAVLRAADAVLLRCQRRG